MLERKVPKLYELVIDEVELTDEKLEQLDFTKKEIDELVQRGTLAKGTNGYSFINVAELSAYGRSLTWDKRVRRAEKCYKKCAEIDSSYFDYEYRKILQSLRNLDYEEAFFDAIQLEKYDKADALLLMVMIRYVGNLKKKSSKKAKGVKAVHVGAVKDKNDSLEVSLEKDLKIKILEHRFCNAIHQFNQLYSDDLMPVRRLAFSKLLSACIEKKQDNQQEYLALLQKGQLQKLMDLLIYNEMNHGIDIVGAHLLMLLNDLFIMQETGVVLPAKRGSKTIFEAIECHDYNSASMFLIEYMEKYGEGMNTDLLKRGLIAIHAVIEGLEAKRNVVPSADKAELKDVLPFIFSENVSIGTACQMLGFDENQTSMVKLQFAKEYFCLGMIDIAQKLLDDVLLRPYKSKTVKKMIKKVEEVKEQVLANKKVDGTALGQILQRIPVNGLV
ncbi:MAG: hypothetical protein K2M17_03150 [Bacilli bacterium]|nr:hypothetical protein [Bacilli bacterium]